VLLFRFIPKVKPPKDFVEQLEVHRIIVYDDLTNTNRELYHFDTKISYSQFIEIAEIFKESSPRYNRL